MSSLLDECQELGDATVLFKLGMILEQGKVGWQDDQGNVIESDVRIGKVLVAEFRHFKDVLTFVWNELTSATQKDVGATLREVTSHRVTGTVKTTMSLDVDVLRRGLDEYNEKYDHYFHRWRAGDLVLDTLVREIKEKSKNLQPCHVGAWSKAIKSELPELLAGISAYFTISKSGESYMLMSNAGSGRGQQLELDTGESRFHVDAKNVLQRPHTIQGLDLVAFIRIRRWLRRCAPEQPTHAHTDW